MNFKSSRPRAVRNIALVITLAIAWLPRADHAANAQRGGGMFGDVNISAILDSLSVSYDKRVRPNYGGPPVEVGVTMYVLSIGSVSEVLMDFTLDFYFRQFWTDPRLAYNKRPGVETLSVGSEFIRNIWVPDTFFVNEKQSYFHIATTSNEFIRIHHSGSITRSIRLTITASCPMDLQYFPMDRQLCNIEIESFGYTMRDIRYKWNEGPNSVGVSSEVSLPQFKVLGHRQRAMEISLTTGNYSRLACEIQFVRSMGYYLIQIYIPSGLIVIISWVSFWLNRNATPARVSLGVTTVLTMTTLMSSTNAALPKISYVKSIDVYLGTCFVMVFASLLEYATVGYMAKRIQMRKQRFTAVQKMAAEKKIQIDGTAPTIPDPLPPPRTSTLTRPAPPSRSSEVRFKVHDQRVYSRGGPLDNAMNGTRGGSVPPLSHSTLNQSHSALASHPAHSIIPIHTPLPVHTPVPHASLPTLVQIPTHTVVPAPTAPAQPAAQPEEEALPPHLVQASKSLNKLLGTTPSDIDKYSRIVFPVCFVCFNLMYWIIYLHVSDVVADDLVLLGEEN